MAKKQRLIIPNLPPKVQYAVQVRAFDGEGRSKWSGKTTFTTIDDTMGGTRKPKAPILDSFTIEGNSWVAKWQAVGRNTDNSPLVINRYELQLSAWDGSVVVAHSPQNGDIQTRTFTLANIHSLLSGIPQTMTLKVRAVNSAGTTSDWSNAKTATLPIPDPPRNPQASGVVDGVTATWEPPLNTANVAGYRVYLGMDDANFTPDKSRNLIYEGTALRASYTSLSYDKEHYFKISTYSAAGMESTTVSAHAKPVSPYGPDDQPPLQPTLGNPTMDRSRPTAPKVNLTWTINETAPENADLAGFVVRWKRQVDTAWLTAYFDKKARGGAIQVPFAYANYEFEIAAYDFVANYSDYEGTKKTLTAALPPPPQVTGLDSQARFDGLKLFWDASTSEGVRNGGGYEIQMRDTNSFTDDVADYRTGETSIDFILPMESTRHFRVRAVDTEGQKGPWSVVHSKTLPGFPLPPASDGVPPATAPTEVSASGGLNFINVTWTQVNNIDATEYEIYMAETDTVTAVPTSLAGRVAGNSMVINRLPNGDPLVMGKTYYFKVRAVDLDGAGPLSASASGKLTKVFPDDLNINLPGENLYLNSSFDTDSNGDGLADYWVVYYSPVTAGVTVTPSLVTGRTGGKAQRVSWNGTTTANRGVYSNPAAEYAEARVLKPLTEYVLSFYARASQGTGFKLAYNQYPTDIRWVENPVPSATEWQRYVVTFKTTTTPDPANAFIALQSDEPGAGWLEIDDAQLEAGNIVSAYKPGTVSVAKLSTGRMSTAQLIVADNGIIQSANYNAGTRTGFALNKNRLDLFDGTVDAKTLRADSSFVNNLNISSTLTVAASGFIRSSNYSTSGTGAGYSISSVGIDIRSGTVAAGLLVAGTITSPDIRIGSGGRLTIDANGWIQSNNYSTAYNSGWKLGFLKNEGGTNIYGLEIRDSNSSINAGSLTTGLIKTSTLYISEGGNMQSITWATGQGAGWYLSENSFFLRNGTIQGSTVRTNQLYSLNTAFVGEDGATTGKYLFSINASGYAEFVGAKIYGNTVVGNSVSNVIQSGNYSSTAGTGWKIQGDGSAELANILSRSSTASGTYIRIGNYANPHGVYAPGAPTGNMAVVAMHTNMATWEPGMFWANYMPTNQQGYVRMTSPRLQSSVVEPATLELRFRVASPRSETTATLNADIIRMSANSYYYGGGSTSGAITFYIDNTVADPRYQWVSGANSVEFRMGSAQNEIISLTNSSTWKRLSLSGNDIYMQAFNATSALIVGRASSASNRANIAAPAQEVSLIWAESAIHVKNTSGSAFCDLVAKNLAASSDMRVKTDIQDYSFSAIEYVNAIPVREYYRLDEKDGKKKIGLIAQEVEEVLPNAVQDTGGDAGKVVDTYHLLSVAWAAIQELTEEVKALKAQLDS